MEELSKLKALAKEATHPITEGLDEESLKIFLETDPLLCSCIEKAYSEFYLLKKKYPELFKLSEEELVKKLQENYINFYPPETINPYVPLAAKGPWIVTTSGAVIHDSGGYGMLGFGHSPTKIIEALSKESHVMANIMTASYKQYELKKLLDQEIGHARKDKGKGTLRNYVCLNSGSEAVGLALRVSDARVMQEQDKEVSHYKYVTLRQSFHGRTDRPAQVSSSSIGFYKKHLASFAAKDNLITVEANNSSCLREVFSEAEKNGDHIQAVIFEPVMGEGNPGLAITPEFYDCARQLTYKHGSTFIIDSIQAGIRATGALSIIDYPGFEKLDPPDCETYSKALNAGQYPLSILAMTDAYAAYYKPGMYGNTMTSNPRALATACAVLESLCPELRQHIKVAGEMLIKEGEKIKSKFGSLIKELHGTGLLFSMEIDPKRAKVVGFDGLEMRMRKKGVGVIHGGKNALRFTPWFGISPDEIKMIFRKLDEVLERI